MILVLAVISVPLGVLYIPRALDEVGVVGSSVADGTIPASVSSVSLSLARGDEPQNQAGTIRCFRTARRAGRDCS